MGQNCCGPSKGNDGKPLKKDKKDDFDPVDMRFSLRKMMSDKNHLNPEFQSDYENLIRNYKFDRKKNKQIGEGAFGKVYLATNNQDINVAIKEIFILGEGQADAIREELKVGLMTLNHPNICQFYESYIGKQAVYVVMEFVKGKDLATNLELEDQQLMAQGQISKVMPEKLCCKIIHALFQAISYMHEQGVAHRDIKPENVIVNKDREIKLIDLGLSKRMKDRDNFDDIVGTPYYVAPEMFKNDHDIKCDLWSLGVLTYQLLSGYTPFEGKDIPDLLVSIQKGKYDFKPDAFKKVSSEAKDLIQKLLLLDPNERIAAQNALKHPWFEKMGLNTIINDPKLNQDLLVRLSKFKGKSKLKQGANIMLIQMVHKEELKQIQDDFKKIDKDQNGFINKEELENAFKTQGLSYFNLEYVIQEVDTNGNGQIDYNEFIAATLSSEQYLSDDEKIRDVFNRIDYDQDGSLTRAELVEALTRNGVPLTQEELDHMIEEHDIDKNGEITFDEFKKMLCDP